MRDKSPTRQSELIPQEMLLWLYLLVGVLVLIGSILVAPKWIPRLWSRLTTATPRSLASEKSEDGGLFKLGQVLVTLGDHSNHLDFKLVLQYDQNTLRVGSDGEIANTPKADAYFRERAPRIKDAIIEQVSQLSREALHGSENLEVFKAGLTSSINNALRARGEPVTGVFFESFAMIPVDD